MKVVLAAVSSILLTALSSGIATAEESSPCAIAKEHFVSLSIDLFRSGTMPAEEDVSALKEKLEWLEANKTEELVSCSEIEREQMKMFLSDLGAGKETQNSDKMS